MEPHADFISQMMDSYTEAISRCFKHSTDMCHAMNDLLGSVETTSGDNQQMDEVIGNLFQHAWTFCQENMEKHLSGPKLGFLREDFQRLADFLDAYNKFMGTAGEFSQKFTVPFKSALTDIQEQIKNEETQIENGEALYQLAVKIFHQKYDAFLKSSEGLKTLMDVVEHYLTCRQKLNDLLEMTLKPLSIPTKKEMEDVCREIYLLKKKTRKQDAMIRKQNKQIAMLSQKIGT